MTVQAQQPSGRNTASMMENSRESRNSVRSVAPVYSWVFIQTAKHVVAAGTARKTSDYSKSLVRPTGTSSSFSNRLMTLRCQPLNDFRSKWTMTVPPENARLVLSTHTRMA